MGSAIEKQLAEHSVLHKLVDSISAMLAYWDSDQRCRFANRAYERWFGVSPEALIGTHISQLLGPLYALNLPYIEGALRGEPQEFEREIPDPAGGPSRHSLANYVPDVVDGQVRGFFVIVTDISALKRAELALRESEAKFSGIISISADAVISVDERQRIVLFNQGAERIFGYRQAEILGAPLDLLLPARARARHQQEVEAFAAGAETTREMAERSAEITGRRKNGEEFVAEGAISKLETGGKRLLTVSLRDVTERKRVESEQQVLAEAGAILASSLDYNETLRCIGRLIVRHSADVCIVDIIARADEVRRLAVAHADPELALVASRLESLQLDQRHTLARSAIDTKQTQLFADIGPELLEKSAQSEEHLRLLRQLGPRSAIVAPLVSANGVLGAIVFVSRTPGRYRPHDLSLATELARRAALAIENARLYQAARQATRARDEVLSIVAHDVRNPLSAIQLATRALERQLPADGAVEARRSVQTIFRSVARANRLIQDLLDTTRIEAGALSISCGALSAKQIAIDAAEAQRLLAEAASIDMRLELESELPAVWADRDRLLQVFENLLGNALKFTPAGGRITIGATARTNEVLFWVSNTGPGIPKESLPHVFDRFWQAKRAERRGAGLGLPICKGIVETHGGRIWVESNDRETTFRFTVPTSAVATLPAQTTAQTRTRSDSSPRIT
ncbi:MAG: sensor histidine kinase [Polyangiales bacterium]